MEKCKNCNGQGFTSYGMCMSCHGIGLEVPISSILKETENNSRKAIRSMENKIPKLTFFGCGGAFCPSLGHTSAFMKISETLVLFDCTEDTTRYIIEHPEIVTGDIILCITHFHPDHISGLGNLWYYLKYGPFDKMPYITILKPEIPLDTSGKYEKRVRDFLKTQYIDISHRNFDFGSNISIPFEHGRYSISFKMIENTSHVNIPDAYHVYAICYDLESKGEDYSYIIYSGDISKFPPALDDHDWDHCERIYIDCSTINPTGSVHYSIEQIKVVCNRLNFDYKKITPVHFSSESVMLDAIKLFDAPIRIVK